jgi:aminocarboxymuconate-semialdehyde decarboxylase
MTAITVDVHAHAVPAGLIGDLAAGRVRFPHVAVERLGHGHGLSFCGGPPTRPVASGLPGVMIATRAGDCELDDPAVIPFWEAADAAGAVVYVHPGFAGSSRYRDFGLVNGLARVEDGTVTLARLLYAGVPARYPRARIVAAHGGGALPYVLGRLARNHTINAGSTADPLESFARLYFDSVVFDPAVLAFLVAKAGRDRVLLGSDYPFPIGDLAPRDVVERAALRAAARARILGGNAALLFAGADAEPR